jgi:uncharacterized iron-regulated membrane protein
MKIVRTIVFWLHLVLGCVAGLVILFMSVTGILLAFASQISAKADAPAALKEKSGPAVLAPLDSFLVVLNQNGQGVPSQLVLHNRANLPVEARFGRERTLYLSPSTAEIIGQPSAAAHRFFSAIMLFHRSLGLGMRNAFGRGLTGAATLAFLFLIISGVYLWVPKILSFASLKSRLLFRTGLQGRAREWNWHSVIGIWTMAPLFVIALTGVIMAYPWASNLLYKAAGAQPPMRQGRGAHGRGPNRFASMVLPAAAPLQARSLDELAQVAKQQVPDWKSITIEVPQPQDQTLHVSIDRSLGGQPEKVSQLVLHRPSGRILAVKNFSDQDMGSKLRAWTYSLHTGKEFGVIGQLIAALACLGAVFLVWTGLSLAVRRARS